jgi:single-strand DNA-binding protein
MNKVMLIGNVGQDPQIRYIDQNVCVAQIRLATTEKGYTLQNGTQVPDRTEWHTVIFWRKQAELIEKYVKKGDKLYVEGKLQTRTWDDKQGIRHQAVEIMAENMEFISRAAARKPEDTAAPAVPAPVTPTAPAPAPEGDEYPF